MSFIPSSSFPSFLERQNPCFEIIQSTDNKGKVIIAKMDLLPGQVIFMEDVLLLRKSFQDKPEFVKLQTKYGLPCKFWAFYSRYQSLTKTEQNRILDLYCPINSVKAIDVQNEIAGYIKWKKWSKTEVDLFVRLYLIFYFHSHHDTINDDDYLAVITSTLSHSCQPNITTSFDRANSMQAWIVTRPIKPKDELTIIYQEEHCYLSTCMRREWYLDEYEFLCECPRCSALGDDTRVFSCVNENCIGLHYICQPTRNELPYFLPCNICNQTVSSEKTQDMLDNETLLTAMGEKFAPDCPRATKCELITNLLLQLEFGDLHTRLRNVHGVATSTIFCYIRDVRSAQMDNAQLLYATKRFIEPLIRNDYVSPCIQVTGPLRSAVKDFIESDCEEGWQLAYTYCQKLLKMMLILYGRDRVREILKEDDKLMCEILTKLPPRPSTITECMFCGERPECAFMKLNLCSGCQKAAYCSKGCQKAHWKLHKVKCKETQT